MIINDINIIIKNSINKNTIIIIIIIINNNNNKNKNTICMAYRLSKIMAKWIPGYRVPRYPVPGGAYNNCTAC